MKLSIARRALPAAVLAGVSVLSSPSFACSSCGCTLSSDWDSQGLSGTPGLKIDLRYDFINQNQLRAGSHKATDAGVNNALAGGTLGEIEQKTTNRYYTLGLDYTLNRSWGVNVQVPFYDRYHSTVDSDTIAAGGFDASSSHLHELGDIKVMGRYQGLSPDGDIGLLFGLKLPTGETTANFTAGPLAGSALDRSLQAGTGSTDLTLGAYRFGALNKDWDWFAQGLFQTALKTRDDYRPGNALNLNGGFRYMSWGRWVPQVQVNAKTGARDTGANADTENSGGTLVYLSPGLTFNMNKSAKVYGFVQLPLYQYVNGVQLAPRWNASIGTTLNF
ncbi:MAG: hypothetical protein P4L70_09420 [Parasulfuritortus sp.]|nr:hypothetical protein [Parasulfuritortus sp.]